MNRKIIFPLTVAAIDLIFISLIAILLARIGGILENQKTKPKFVYQLKKEFYFHPEDSKLAYYYEQRPNVKDKFRLDWMPGEITYTINSDGLNERYEYKAEKKDTSFRILTMGDSLTFGANVNTDRNYPEKLEDLLNSGIDCRDIDNFEVINLGVPGFDVEYSIELFKRKGLKYQPDLILWFLNYWNLDNINELKLPVYKGLIEKGIPDFDTETSSHSAHEIAAEQVANEYGLDKLLEMNKGKLKEFRKIYKNNLIFITFADFPSEHAKIIQELSGSDSKIEYLSAIENFNKDKNLILPDNHPSTAGYDKLSREISEYLIADLLNDCEKTSGF